MVGSWYLKEGKPTLVLTVEACKRTKITDKVLKRMKVHTKARVEGEPAANAAMAKKESKLGHEDLEDVSNTYN